MPEINTKMNYSKRRKKHTTTTMPASNSSYNFKSRFRPQITQINSNLHILICKYSLTQIHRQSMPVATMYEFTPQLQAQIGIGGVQRRSQVVYFFSDLNTVCIYCIYMSAYIHFRNHDLTVAYIFLWTKWTTSDSLIYNQVHIM